MAAQTITVAQQKARRRRTTLAARLAVVWAASRRLQAARHRSGQPQGLGRVAARERLGDGTGAEALGLEFAALAGWRAGEWIERRAREADIVIVDGPPHAELETKIALRAATLVVVPVQPSPLDLWSSATTFRLAREENRSVLAVLNRVPARSGLTEMVAAQLVRDGVRVAAARLGSRVAFAQAMAQGRGVVETAPNGVAAAEITALAAEIAAK